MGNRWLSLRDCVLSIFICEGIMLYSIVPNNFSDLAWLIHCTNWELSLLPTFTVLVTCKHWAVNKGNSFLLRLNSRPRFSLFAFSFPRLWLPCGLTLLWQVSFDKTRCHTGDSLPFFQNWHCCRSPCWYFRRDAAKIWSFISHLDGDTIMVDLNLFSAEFWMGCQWPMPGLLLVMLGEF